MITLGRLRGSYDWAHGERTPRLDGFNAINHKNAASLRFFHLCFDCHELSRSFQYFSGNDGVVIASASCRVGVSDFEFHGSSSLLMGSLYTKGLQIQQGWSSFFCLFCK